MERVFLLLGSNEGDRFKWLEQARALSGQQIGRILQASSVYETAPWGLSEQPHYLNQVLVVDSALSPLDLLQEVAAIEQQLGRQRLQRWGQRSLDLDILFYGAGIIDLPQLRIPHPLLQERRFTLEPLSEIAPELVHPVLGKTIRELLATCPDPLETKRLEP